MTEINDEGSQNKVEMLWCENTDKVVVFADESIITEYDSNNKND